MTTISCLTFARENNCGGTLLGTEFLGWSLDQLKAELNRLNMPAVGRSEGETAANMRAGGVERVRKLQLITAFMQNAGVQTWNHDQPKDAFSARMEAEIEREDKALGKLPEALSDLHMEHSISLAQIDAQADALEAAIVHNEEVEKRVRAAAYEHGAGGRELRHDLDAAAVRDATAKRFRDGLGKVRDGVTVAGRINIWRVITDKFKQAA